MKHFARRVASIGAFTLLLITALYSVAEDSGSAPAGSGFLSSDIEAKMTKTSLASGREVDLWLSPELKSGGYKAAMVDRMTIYPAPNPGPQISSSTLEAVVDYSTEMMRKFIGEKISVQDTAGPGVLRVQAVFTSVATKKEGLTAKDILPIHLLFSAAEAATGNMDMEVTVRVEARITDSVTGAVLGASKSKLTGEKLKNSEQQLELANVQKILEKAAQDGAGFLGEAVQQ